MADAGISVTKEEGLGLSTTIDTLVFSKLEASIKNYVLPEIVNTKNMGISSKSSFQRDYGMIVNEKRHFQRLKIIQKACRTFQRGHIWKVKFFSI